MRPGRVVALVAGILLIVPSLGILLGGVALGVVYGVARDGDGFVAVDLDRLETDTVAITAGEVDFEAEPGTPDWFWSALDTDVRIRVDGTGDGEIFVGIAPSSDVARYLAAVEHDELIDLDDGPEYRRLPGADEVAPPAEQTFWEVSAAGATEQEIRWDVRGGSWTAVLMNADGSAGLAADVNVGLRSGAVVPIAIALGFFGALFTTAAVLLIVYGAAGARTDRPTNDPVAPGIADEPAITPGGSAPPNA